MRRTLLLSIPLVRYIPVKMAVWGLGATAAAQQAHCPAGLTRPPSTWASGAVACAPGTPPAPRPVRVCMRLQYAQCGHQLGGLSTPHCVDVDAAGACNVTVDAAPGVQQYRLYRVRPEDPGVGCLKLATESPSQWQEPALAFADACPFAYALDWPDGAASFAPLGLVLGTTYYATLRVWNAAGLSATKASDGVTWQVVDLIAGTVRDGPYPGQDWDGTVNDTALSATWEGFQSSYGADYFQVRFSGSWVGG